MKNGKIKIVNRCLLILLIISCIPVSLIIAKKAIKESQPTNRQMNNKNTIVSEESNKENRWIEIAGSTFELTYSYTDIVSGEKIDNYIDENENEYGFCDDKLENIIYNNPPKENKVNLNDIEESAESVISNYMEDINIEDYELTDKTKSEEGYDLTWTRMLNGFKTSDTITVSVNKDSFIDFINFSNTGTVTDDIIDNIEYSDPTIAEQEAISIFKNKFCEVNDISNMDDIKIVSTELQYNEELELIWVIEGEAEQKLEVGDNTLTYVGISKIDASSGEIIQFLN